MRYLLSKSKLQAFHQCERRLWLEVHRPNLARFDEATELILERGTQFGETVRKCFPWGQLINTRNSADALAATQEHFRRFSAGEPRPPLFEAAFAYRDVIARLDILEPGAGGSWNIIEVKSGTLGDDGSPKENYIRDVAIQGWVAERAGLKIARLELGVPSKNFVLTEAGAIDGILDRVDVTEEAKRLYGEIEQLIGDATAIGHAGDEPGRRIGPHCDKPNACGFMNHCADTTLRPDETIKVPVWYLAGKPNRDPVRDLLAANHRDLAKVPETALTKPIHRAMRRVARGEIERYLDPALKEWLDSQPWPRYFLDFETNSPPLPLWRGTRPGERIAFQYSLHKWSAPDQPPTHAEFIGKSQDDPRPALATHLLEHAAEPGPVYAWNGNGTESSITAALIPFCPAGRAVLERIADSCKTNDPLPRFRRSLYLPGMQNWSLKSIAAALLPRSPYEDLRIRNGVQAMREYEKFIALPASPERESIKSDLLAYCRVDTEVMIDIWRQVSGG